MFGNPFKVSALLPEHWRKSMKNYKYYCIILKLYFSQNGLILHNLGTYAAIEQLLGEHNLNVNGSKTVGTELEESHIYILWMTVSIALFKMMLRI